VAKISPSILRLERNSGPHARYCAALRPGRLSSTSALKVVAVASEENTLQLWAAVPRQEPHSTAHGSSAQPACRGGALANFGLTQLYTLRVAGQRVAPNGGKTPGAMCARWWRAAPVGLTTASSPARSSTRFIRVRVWMQCSTACLDPPGLAGTALVPVGAGQAISYTLRYENRGSKRPGRAGEGQSLWRATLRGGSDTATFTLGDLTAGISGHASRSTPVIQRCGRRGRADITLSDALHGDFDWLWR